MFNTQNDVILNLMSGVTDEAYDTGTLIALCDSPDVRYSKIENENTVISSVKFFTRTHEGNFVVVSKQENEALVSSTPLDIPDNDISFNEYFVMCAKMFLTKTLFPNNKPSEIGFSTIPTPFGVIRKSDGKFEAVFQLVLNMGLAPFTLKLSDNFGLVYVESLKDMESFKNIYKQFRKTKEVD